MKTENLKKQVKTIMLASLSVAMFAFVGCDKDDDQPLGTTKNIVQIARETPQLSTLVTAVEVAGLGTTLSGDGPFTVFAPTNAAFDKLEEGVLQTLIDNPTILAQVLQYHVLNGKVMASDATSGSFPTLLNGASLNLEVNGSTIMINDLAKVVGADVEASNGIVHLIDEVLIPPTIELPKDNIFEIAESVPTLTTLVSVLNKFPDLVNALSSDGTYTVFAPDNDAFAALLVAIGQTSIDDVPESVLRKVLEYHVISVAAVMSGDLSDGQTADAISGEQLTVTINGSDVLISGSKVTMPDVEASNGVVHIMENVMVPPSIVPIVGTIVAPAYFNKDFTLLIAAVLAADEDILSVLLSDGPSNQGLTLFAPTNDAFAAAGITTLPDGATLSAVLKYHVYDGTVMAGDLPSSSRGAVPLTSLGGDFYLSNVGGEAGVFLNGNTEVVVPNIEASNGVVHVINRTLIPPSSNVVEIAQSYNPDEFTQLVAALARTSGQDADLLSALSGDGAFTVFAPTDAAFEALYAVLEVDSVDEIPLATLTAVLQHHVVATPRVFSPDLESGTFLTLNGNITIDATNGKITDGSGADANLADAALLNVLGTNGVIHVIDKVLIP